MPQDISASDAGSGVELPVCAAVTIRISSPGLKVKPRSDTVRLLAEIIVQSEPSWPRAVTPVGYFVPGSPRMVSLLSNKASLKMTPRTGVENVRVPE